MDIRTTIDASFNKSCPACKERRRHSLGEFVSFHPRAGEGVSREHGSPSGKVEEKENDK